MPSIEQKDKKTQTANVEEDLNQTNKPQLPFNIKTEISKLKISVSLAKLVKNQFYRS